MGAWLELELPPIPGEETIFLSGISSVSSRQASDLTDDPAGPFPASPSSAMAAVDATGRGPRRDGIKIRAPGSLSFIIEQMVALISARY